MLSYVLYKYQISTKTIDESKSMVFSIAELDKGFDILGGYVCAGKVPKNASRNTRFAFINSGMKNAVPGGHPTVIMCGYYGYLAASYLGSSMTIGYNWGLSTSNKDIGWINKENGRYLAYNSSGELAVYSNTGGWLATIPDMKYSYGAYGYVVQPDTLENGKITDKTLGAVLGYTANSVMYYYDDTGKYCNYQNNGRSFLIMDNMDDTYAYMKYMTMKDGRDKTQAYYNTSVFYLFADSTPVQSIYWNGEFSENPIIAADGQKYLHTDAYVWGGNFAECYETIFGYRNIETGDDVLTKYASWDEYYECEAYNAIDWNYECYTGSDNWLGYKGEVLEASAGTGSAGVCKYYDSDLGDWVSETKYFKVYGGVPQWEHWWKRNPHEPYPKL